MELKARGVVDLESAACYVESMESGKRGAMSVELEKCAAV